MGGFFTISYDTSYAFQDLKDDKRFGIKSFAIILEEKPEKKILFISLLSYLFFTFSILQINHINFFLGTTLSLPILICIILQNYLFCKKKYKLVFDFSAFTGLVISLVLLITNYL